VKTGCDTAFASSVTRVHSGTFPRRAVPVWTVVTCAVVALLIGGVAAPASAKAFNLHRGSHGVTVRTLEIRLHHLGLLRGRAVDRRYTRVTARAVRRFQRSHHLRVTGRVNVRTFVAIARAAAPKPPPPPPPKPVLLAHRGGAYEANVPENSLSSMQYGVAKGADILEFDLQLTADDQFVLMHDTTLDRTTTCTGPVSAQSLSSIETQCFMKRARDLQQTQERVPTYAEIAQYADSVGKPIAPEIKTPNADLTDADIAQFVGTTQDSGMATRTYLQSFEGSTVFPRVHRLAPALHTIFLSSRNVSPSVVTTAGSSIASPEYHSVTAAWLASYHAAGLSVWTWTVDDVPTIKRLWFMGTNGIFTNYPAAARALLH
jgi:glycerophosphoryl diester phosphodiesterase